MRYAGGRHTWALAALVAAYWGHATPAQSRDHVVGNWLISETVDRFGGGVKVTALHGNGAGAHIGLRCLGDTAAIVLTEGEETYRPVESVNVKFRADDGEIINTFAKAVNGEAIEVTLKPGMLGAIAKARRISFRITTSVASFDRSYVAKGNGQAVAAIQKACPLDE